MNTKVVKRKGQENKVGKLLAQILVQQCIHSFAAHLHTHQTKPPALKASIKGILSSGIVNLRWGKKGQVEDRILFWILFSGYSSWQLF